MSDGITFDDGLVLTFLERGRVRVDNGTDLPLQVSELTVYQNNSRRKSMRLAADPCLGFYVLPPSNSVDNLVPPIEVLSFEGSDEDGDVEGPVVSVDTFLRRNALANTTTYSKKSHRKDRRKRQDVPNPLCSEVLPPAEIPLIPPHANPTHFGSKSLTKRLLSAAVLSNVDPETCLLQDDPVPHSRKPLPLVAKRRPSCEPVQTKRRTWSLTDPRKALPRSNSFTHRASSRHIKSDTLSGWRATIYLDGAITKRKAKASKTPPKCVPLSFVPLHEAEKAYSLMRLPHKVVTEALKLIQVSAERVPLEFRHSSFPTQTDYVAPEATPPKLPCASLSATSSAARPMTIILPTADDPMPPAAPFSNSHLACALEDCDASISLPPLSVSPQMSNGNLQPLAYFFEQFLQNARAETARAETQVEQTSQKKAPRKASQHPTRKTTPQPFSTLKSYLRTAVRQTSSNRPALLSSADFPFCTSLNGTNHVASELPLSSLTHFRLPSIPVEHHISPPAPYHVVLPSTPPAPSCPGPEPFPVGGDDHAADSSVNLFCFTRVCTSLQLLQFNT
ncbi:hypothetical protein C8R47DRAFT_1213543 [Mycena vitilis]|nr:hypothetical protein C8R47DRAFT_1213543 [Mycena vitilis]